MRKLNRLWLFFTSSLVCLLLGYFSVLLASSPVTEAVTLKTNPPLQQVVPSEQAVHMMLQGNNLLEQANSDVHFGVRLIAPAKTPWLTTDFPNVEGTTLLEMNSRATEGRLDFQQVLPIRGTYELQVRAVPTVAAEISPFEQSVQFLVLDNPVKYRNAGILMVILLLVGLGGGWAIGGRQAVEPGAIAPQAVRLFLSGAIVVTIAALLLVNINAELVARHLHGVEATSNMSTNEAVGRSQTLEARLVGDTHATVGQLATQTIQVTDTTTGNPVQGIKLNIQSIRLEDHQIMFAHQTWTDAEGQFTWREQFVDGAPHQVVVDVSPAPDNQPFQPFQIAQQIEVEAIAPPLHVRFITLMYFTGIFALGLVAGLRWRYRRESRRSLA